MRSFLDAGLAILPDFASTRALFSSAPRRRATLIKSFSCFVGLACRSSCGFLASGLHIVRLWPPTLPDGQQAERLPLPPLSNVWIRRRETGWPSPDDSVWRCQRLTASLCVVITEAVRDGGNPRVYADPRQSFQKVVKQRRDARRYLRLSTSTDVERRCIGSTSRRLSPAIISRAVHLAALTLLVTQPSQEQACIPVIEWATASHPGTRARTPRSEDRLLRPRAAS